MPQEKKPQQSDPMKEREYKDEKGEIHHHTKKKMEQERGKSKGKS